MRFFIKLFLIQAFISAYFVSIARNSGESLKNCQTAFKFKSEEFADSINVCIFGDTEPAGYLAQVDMVVCDDKLCANVLLKLYWDFAGNYLRFDTIAGKPLTKFDHKKFNANDYQKLDRILKDKNSMLRVLEKEDLIDKNVKIKATTVDAVTGATPATIKNAVVEGAVYTSYALWHFVNGSVGNRMRTYTLLHFSEDIANLMFSSANYETQLFAIKQIKSDDYSIHFEQICKMITRGVPLIKAYLIGKIPLPFNDQEQNKKLVLLFPGLDSYSKSVFIDRVTADHQLAVVFLPLMKTQLESLDQKQLDKYRIACQKFGIPGY
jgi:hypothetical protein